MPNPNKKPERRKRGRPAKVHAQGDIALLDAAQSAFARYGFEGATLRGVAANAGVDPALVAHYFGSKKALWEAVVDRMAQRLLPLITDLEDLNRQTDIPIRIRLGNSLWQLISAVGDEPEFGMFLSRAGAENNERLTLLIRKILRPHHDAFLPILLEAMRQKVIGDQPVEILYFMLVQAIVMTVSYRHMLGQVGASVDDIAKLKTDVMHCLYATFLEQHNARMTAKEAVRSLAAITARSRGTAHQRSTSRKSRSHRKATVSQTVRGTRDST